MNAVVRDYPELKLASLPQNVDGGYLVELSVRGDPARVPGAMAYVRAEVAKLGYPFEDRAPALSPWTARRAFLAALRGAPGRRRPRADEALWAQLRDGGHVILIRHAATDPGLGDPPGFRLDDCATQRNLSEAGPRGGAPPGRAPARRARADRARLHQPLVPLPRHRDARLRPGRGLGPALLGLRLARTARPSTPRRVKKRILGYSIRKPGGNVVMVTHNVNIAALTKLSVAPGEMVVVRPDGCCALRTVGPA